MQAHFRGARSQVLASSGSMYSMESFDVCAIFGVEGEQLV